jgi:hypothetical protein
MAWKQAGSPIDDPTSAALEIQQPVNLIAKRPQRVILPNRSRFLVCILSGVDSQAGIDAVTADSGRRVERLRITAFVVVKQKGLDALHMPPTAGPKPTWSPSCSTVSRDAP